MSRMLLRNLVSHNFLEDFTKLKDLFFVFFPKVCCKTKNKYLLLTLNISKFSKSLNLRPSTTLSPKDLFFLSVANISLGIPVL